MCKYFITWLVMLLASIANGVVRDFTYGKHMSELSAHQLSTVISVLVLAIVIWFFVKKYPPASTQQAALTGILWMTLTIAFEFLFFHYVGGHSWSALLANYNVFNGRVWVALLIWVAIAPYIFFRINRGQKRV
jgi:hypothetical protein